MEGQALASKLMVELCGARPVGGTIDVGGPGPALKTVRLRDARTAGLLGEAIPRAESAAILERLGFGVAEAGDGLDVTVPPWRRRDVYREADLIEEVARIHGLESLPSTLPSRRDATGRLTVAQRLRRRAQDALVGCGLSEAVGWSFVAPDLADRLTLPATDPRRRAVALVNPLSEDQSVMRTTLLGSLLDALRHNTARGMEDVRLFEYGAVYLAREDNGAEPLPDERQHLAALLTGSLRPASWRESEPPRADFFAAKGVLETLLRALRVEWVVEPAGEPFLHPGRSAAVVVSAERIGWLGELHPVVAAAWDLPQVAGFELDFGALARAATAVPSYEDVTSYPGIRQDLAVVLADTVPAGEVVGVVREAGGALLRAAEVFDVYRGAQVGEGRVSLALRLEFRAADRTLTDEEVTAPREKIVAALADKLGGEIRA
jgi:phenylalanyl-tRNA synthetase beta chain